MKLLLAGCLMAATLTACERRDANDSAAGGGMAADTIVTERTTQDTAVITHDTSITVDTSRKAGSRPTEVDTVR